MGVIVLGVQRYNHKVTNVSIVIGNVLWEVVSCYSPQSGRSVMKRRRTNDELMDKFVASKVLVDGDFNDHVVSDMGGFVEVHGGFGIGQI